MLNNCHSISRVAPDHSQKISYHGFTEDEINELKGNFQKFDINNDGYIDIHELEEIMKILGDKYDHDSLREILGSGNSEVDGKLSFYDYISLVYQSKIVSLYVTICLYKYMYLCLYICIYMYHIYFNFSFIIILYKYL